MRDNPEALDALDKVTQAKPGAPAGNQNAAKAETTVDIVHVCSEPERPDGNSAARALRRLRSQKPDLHARVLAGELSPQRWSGSGETSSGGGT